MLIPLQPTLLLAAEPQDYRVDIPAGSLHEALMSLARQTKNSVLFERDSVSQLEAPAVKGRLTVAEALDRLIAEHCLEYEFVRERFVTVIPGCSQTIQTPPAPIADASTPLPTPEGLVEEILVRERYITGSRIRNAAFGQNMPLDVIDRTEIRLSGFQSVGELLKYVPAVSGNSTSTLISNGGDGTATVTLRGLPASNTLVLLNGRRLNSDALRGRSVDLNTLPLAMIERVELLKDGASAIYGSDAIAGVVNIITKQSLDGVKVDAYTGEATDGALRTHNYTLEFGVGDDNWSVYSGLTYYDQSGLESRDRSLSASSDDRDRGGIDKRSSATSPARLTLESRALTLIEGAPGESAVDYRNALSEDRFEYRDFTTSIVPSKRLSGFLTAQTNLSEVWRGYVEALYTDTEAVNQLAQVPLFTAFEAIELTIPAQQIFNPFDQDISDLRRRVTELPPRRQTNESESTRLVVGAQAQGQDYNLDFALQYSRTSATELFRNGINAQRVAEAIAVDCVAPCVPINLFGPEGSISQAMLDYVSTGAEVTGKSEMYGASLNVDWLFGSTPAGRIEISAGLEYRHEGLDVRPDEILLNKLLVGGGNRTATDGARDILEAYAEVYLPILKDRPWAKRLDLQLASRTSHYSDFGIQVNPRMLVTWAPNETLVFRGSVASGFRAPGLQQLHGSTLQSFEQLNDPCTQSANVGVFQGCTTQSDPTLTQFQVLGGGDSSLDPEESQTLTFGMLLQRDFANTSLEGSVDWYYIDQRDVVESSAQFVINQNAQFGAFADRVRRNSDGNIEQVTATLQNIGERTAKGFDVTASLTHEFTDLGRLTMAMNATHINEFRDKFDPDSPSEDKAGTFSDEASGGLGGLPDWKVSFSVQWQSAHWQAYYNIYRVSELDEVVPLKNITRTIDSWTTHNANVSYLGPATAWTRVTLGISNIFDEAPPFSAAAFNDSYDARTYDITGRYLFLKLDRTF